MNMHHQLRQQQDEPLLQLQQAGDWSHGPTPQVADSLACDTPVPIRVVPLNQPAGNPLWLQEVPTGAAPAVADNRPAPTQPGLTQYFHPPAVHKEWRVEVAAPMETAAGSDQSCRFLGWELKRASAAAEEDTVPGASTVPYERPVVQQHMATRGYGGQHVPSARALMGMLAESKRQRAHTAEVAYGQLQQLQKEKAMAMEQAFLSEKARADTAERHAAEMRRVVHVLKDHVLKEQASSSTRPVFSTDLKEHRAARDQAAPAAGRKKQQQQKPEQLPERPGVIWVGATPELDT